MAKHTILFLAANPSGTDRRALDQEASSIRKELKRSGYRDWFELVTWWAAEPHDLLRGLRELKPAIVHFSGYGGHDGLFFQGAKGDAQIVSPAAIAETFGAAGSSVQLAVLSACYSEAPAEALLAHVGCVVGMGGALHDDMAKAFAIGFYGGLANQESIAAAYRHGNAAISLDGLSDVERPQLKVRDGIDATQLVLAAIAPTVQVVLPCPYPGMRPYSADDADRFYGRSAEIDELLGRLRAGEREIYVIGPSGSGKSSLVAAGVLPRLARGVAGLGPFLVRSMRPGDRPAARLNEVLEVSNGKTATPAAAIAALLAHRAPGSSVLIVIDQLEELFTLADAGERERFLTALGALRAEPRCVVVFTLRADFFGTFMESPLWKERRGRISRIEVGPLGGDALREGIAQPAHDRGVRVEPELLGQLLADAGSEPGVLPLLQETLVQLWERRQGKALTLADYETLGDRDRSGLAVALARRADTTLRALTPTQEAIARRILLRLISFGEGRSDTRRQQPRSKLRAASDDVTDFDTVLRRLIADRLLTADEDDHVGEARVDLAHEVMIAAWPTLAGWIQTHRVEEQRRRQLEAAAALWVEHGRSARGLLDAIELADAEAWQRTDSAREVGQSVDIAALVAASRAAHDKQRRRRRGLVWIAFATLAAFALAVATLAIMARRRADDSEDSRNRVEASRKQAEVASHENERLLALSLKEAGRQLLLEEHPQEAIPYLIAARQRGGEEESLRMLISIATRSLPLIPLLEHQAPVSSATFSPDGTRVVTASWDNTARTWDAATGKPLAALQHQDKVKSAAFSPDSMRVVTASDDHTARVWDAATGKPLTPPLQHQDQVKSAAFSPDGTCVVTASLDNTARIWDAVTGKLLVAPLQHQDQVRSAAFSPDGTRVVTASLDHTARIWDAATGKPLTPPLQHRDQVKSAAFSPDGARVVTVSSDSTARIWNAATGKILVPPLQHQAPVWNAAFSPDGTRVVTASLDNTARIWDVATGRPITPPLQHRNWVLGAAFSPDGTRVVTASLDNTARIWDAATGRPLAPPLQHQNWVVHVAFSPDGTRIVTASADHAAHLWNATADEPFVPPLQHQDQVNSAAFSPDGTRIVTASADRAAHLWDATSGKPVAAPLEHQNMVWSAAFSPDSTRVVTASDDHTARVWDAATGRPLTPPLRHDAPVKSAAFSPDGTRVVTASFDNTARIWDAATGKPLALPLQHDAPLNSAAFSPDGTRVVTTSFDKTARIWDVATGKPIAPPLQHQARVNSAVFSPDGTRVVTASFDKTARIWDAATGKPFTPPLRHQAPVWSAVFSPDGTRVVTAGFDRTARLWNATTGKPLAPPLQHQAPVWSAAFSPDGTRIVTASFDKTARIWDTATGKPIAPPLRHQNQVKSAAFSPDGARVVTASLDKTAHVWETQLDETPPSEWSTLATRSPFVLSNGVHVLRCSLTQN